MKNNFLVLFTLFLFSNYLVGQNNLNCEKDKQLKKTVKMLCYDVLDATSEGIEVPEWKDTMREFYGYSGTSDEFNDYFNNFLNTNKQCLICPELKITTTIYPSHHLFKRMLALGLDEVYEEYFYNFEDGDVDFNAYEIIDGEKETLLDWVIKWIAQGHGSPSELLDVTSALEDEFGAKYGKDLPD